MKRILYFLCICICILSYGCSSRTPEQKQDKITLTVAVPASDREIISKYLNLYKSRKGIDFKIIDVSGDSEDIHRFYVSTCMDNKFNVDVYLMEDKWVKEFAKCDYIDEMATEQYDFIPSVCEAVTYADKSYAMPVYADAFAEFTKRDISSGGLMYLQDGTEDYVTGVYSMLDKTGVLESAVDEYEKYARSNNTDDFLFGDYYKARGWLGQYNIMKERHAVEASRISIDIAEDALIKTKVFAIRKGTEYKEELKDVFDFLLSDSTQKSLMTDKIAIPVLKSFYERDDLYDITPHILKISGMDFTSLKTDENYNAYIKELGTVINQPENGIQNKLELIGRLINK